MSSDLIMEFRESILQFALAHVLLASGWGGKTQQGVRLDLCSASSADCRNGPSPVHDRPPAQNPHTYGPHRSANVGGSHRGRQANQRGDCASRNTAEGRKTRDQCRSGSSLIRQADRPAIPRYLVVSNTCVGSVEEALLQAEWLDLRDRCAIPSSSTWEF